MTEDDILAAEIMCTLKSVPINVKIIDDFINPPSKLTKKKKVAKRKVSSRPHQLIPFPIKPQIGFHIVPNSDICFTYPRIILNALQSSNEKAFTSFMRLNCVPDVELISEYEHEQNPFGPNHRHFTGVNNVITFFLAIMSSAPDAVITFDRIKVFRKEEETKQTLITYEILISQTRTNVIVDHINTQTAISSSVKRVRKTDSITNIDDITTNGTTETEDVIPQQDRTNPNTVDNITKSLNKVSFTTKPIVAVPIIRNFYVGNHTFDVNSELKITRICELFHFTNEDPRVSESDVKK